MVFPFNSLADFEVRFSEEYEEFRRSVREFAERVVRPRIGEIRREREIPEEIMRKAAEIGFFGLGIPEKYGGQGESSVPRAVATEEIARVSPGLSAVLLNPTLFFIPVLLWGTEEQRKKYLPKIAKGELYAAHASTEPEAGSDIASMKTTARKEGDGYVINGRKIFISSAHRAGVFLVSARTSPMPSERSRRWWGITCFIVERDTEGLRVGEEIPVTGLEGEKVFEVILDNVKVPEENIVGQRDEGFKILVNTYNRSRVDVAAQAVGVGQALLEKTFEYVNRRVAFDRKIADFQAVQFKLADMLIELQASRLMTYWAAHMLDRGDPRAAMVAAMAKTFASEAAERIALRAITLHGGVGVSIDGGVEQFLRDIQIFKTYDGTNDIQRLTIARQFLEKV